MAPEPISIIIVIILTALDSDQDQLGGYQAGADIYLVKPVASRVLESVLVRLADRLTTPQSDHPGTKQWLIDQAARTMVSPDDGTIPLTDLELKFHKLWESPGKAGGLPLGNNIIHLTEGRLLDHQTHS